jgi:hypothetical protein
VEGKEVWRGRPLLSELQVPEWQDLAVDRRKWGKMPKSTKTILRCRCKYKHKKLYCLHRDTALINCPAPRSQEARAPGQGAWLWLYHRSQSRRARARGWRGRGACVYPPAAHYPLPASAARSASAPPSPMQCNILYWGFRSEVR